LSHKWSDILEKLNDLNYESKKTSLHINLAKREEMRINNKSNNTIILENKTIRKVADFTYLSSNVSEDGGAVKDVNIRIQKARGAFSRLWKIWQSTHIHNSTKIKIYNSCVKSVLLYGCETWFVSTEIQRKLQSFINQCLRYICRIRWPRVISNEKLWKESNQENVNMEIRRRKFRWIGHTLRKSDREPCKAALMWNPEGSRKRGRPRNSWRRSTLTEVGKRSWRELRPIARDRRKWKELVDNLCS
jgi:hypothetical protein